MGYEHIIAADGLVDEKNDRQINVHADENTAKGFPCGTETFDSGHINGRCDDQSMRDEGLEETVMWKAINSQIGSQQSL